MHGGIREYNIGLGLPESGEVGDVRVNMEVSEELAGFLDKLDTMIPLKGVVASKGLILYNDNVEYYHFIPVKASFNGSAKVTPPFKLTNLLENIGFQQGLKANSRVVSFTIRNIPIPDKDSIPAVGGIDEANRVLENIDGMRIDASLLVDTHGLTSLIQSPADTYFCPCEGFIIVFNKDSLVVVGRGFRVKGSPVIRASKVTRSPRSTSDVYRITYYLLKLLLLFAYDPGREIKLSIGRLQTGSLGLRIESPTGEIVVLGKGYNTEEGKSRDVMRDIALVTLSTGRTDFFEAPVYVIPIKRVYGETEPVIANNTIYYDIGDDIIIAYSNKAIINFPREDSITGPRLYSLVGYKPVPGIANTLVITNTSSTTITPGKRVKASLTTNKPEIFKRLEKPVSMPILPPEASKIMAVPYPVRITDWKTEKNVATAAHTLLSLARRAILIKQAEAQIPPSIIRGKKGSEPVIIAPVIQEGKLEVRLASSNTLFWNKYFTTEDVKLAEFDLARYGVRFKANMINADDWDEIIHDKKYSIGINTVSLLFNWEVEDPIPVSVKLAMTDWHEPIIYLLMNNSTTLLFEIKGFILE